jgi:hypothetical protein
MRDGATFGLSRKGDTVKQWICIFGLLGSILSQGTSPVHGQVVLAKLDLSEVSFVLMTKDKFHQQLRNQALNQFSKAGLHLKSEHGYPRLLLTLNPHNSEFSKDVDIYERKLELLEEVTIPRSGHKRVVTTWFYGVDPAIETKTVTFDDLQSDLERMLKVFIDQYKFLNPQQKQAER